MLAYLFSQPNGGVPMRHWRGNHKPNGICQRDGANGHRKRTPVVGATSTAQPVS